VLYATGRGGPQDLARAATLLHSACERHDADACNNYAWMLAFGDGVEANPELGRKKLERGCEDGGSIDACNNLAWLEVIGLGGPRRMAKGTARMQSLCDRGVVAARRACEGGYIEGCDDLDGESGV
jgi:TPR repeat protein